MSLFAWVTVHIPEDWVDAIVGLVLAVGGWSDPTDACECVYLPFVRFVLEA
jgi:hypothetical protein